MAKNRMYWLNDYKLKRNYAVLLNKILIYSKVMILQSSAILGHSFNTKFQTDLLYQLQCKEK